MISNPSATPYKQAPTAQQNTTWNRQLQSWDLQEKHTHPSCFYSCASDNTFFVCFIFIHHFNDFLLPVGNKPPQYLMVITRDLPHTKNSKYKLCLTIIWSKIMNPLKKCQKDKHGLVSKTQTEGKLCRRTLFSRITVLLQNCTSQCGHKKKPSPEDDPEWRIIWGFRHGSLYLPISRHYTLVICSVEALEGVRGQITWSMMVAGTGVSAPDSTLAEIKKLHRAKHAKTVDFSNKMEKILVKKIQITRWEETLQADVQQTSA